MHIQAQFVHSNNRIILVQLGRKTKQKLHSLISEYDTSNESFSFFSSFLKVPESVLIRGLSFRNETTISFCGSFGDLMNKYFHGENRFARYFQGGYFRCQAPDGHSLALIPAFHVREDGNRSASIQVITEERAAAFK